jgi:4-hydroxy-tetrahydrodipicolinate synthase
MTLQLTGVIPILPTPFHEDESVDLESLDRLVRFQTAAGVDAVTILGQLDQSTRLTTDERAAVIRTAVAAAGNVPVVVGASFGTDSPTSAAQQAADLGAAAVAIAPPLVERASPDTVVDHFERVSASVAAPIVFMDHPVSTRMNLSTETMLRVLCEIPTIVSMRMPSLTNPQRIAMLRRGLGERSVTILTGLGALWGLLDLERGADGFHAAFAFPEVLLAVLSQFRSNNRSGARQILTKYLPLIAFEQQSSLALRREILVCRGLLTTSHSRESSSTPDTEARAQVRDLLDAVFPGETLSRPLDVTASRPFLVNI